MLYIYIYSIIFYFFNSVPVYNRKAGPAHRSARALREGAPRGGRVAVAPKRPRSTASEPTVALHRSARVVRAVNVVH